MGYIDRGDDGPPGVGFADHFEWDGIGWHYFRNGWKAPVSLSDDEYHRAIAWHENGTLAMIAGCASLALAMIFVPLPWVDVWQEDVRAISGILVIILVGLAGFSALKWLATRPFKNRKPVGPLRDRMELRRQRLANTSWRSLCGTTALFGAVSLLYFFGSRQHFAGVFWVFLMLQVAYQAFQKWRFERRPAASTSA